MWPRQMIFVAEPGPAVAVTTILVLAAATFAPIHFVHPFRVRDYGRWLPILALAWAVATATLLWPDWDPPVWRALLLLSLVSAAILVGMGLWRTYRGPRTSPAY